MSCAAISATPPEDATKLVWERTPLVRSHPAPLGQQPAPRTWEEENNLENLQKRAFTMSEGIAEFKAQLMAVRSLPCVSRRVNQAVSRSAT